MTFGSVAVTCIVQKNLELPRECIQKIVIRISGLVVVMNNDRSNPHFCDHYQVYFESLLYLSPTYSGLIGLIEVLPQQT